ncbi:hypothetical protein [Prevotella koreensis]|nr:hypothetical protein [Prevotella koreensis]
MSKEGEKIKKMHRTNVLKNLAHIAVAVIGIIFGVRNIISKK